MGRVLSSRRPALRRTSGAPAAALAVALVLICAAALVVVVRHDRSPAPGPDTATSPGLTSPSALVPPSAVTVRRFFYLPTPSVDGAAQIPRPPADSPPPPDPRQNYGDLYLPPGPHPRDSLPLVVLIHGGGWTARYSAATFDPLARALAATGLAVFNVEYRRIGSGGGWPTTFTDVAAATDYVPTLDRENPMIDASSSTVVGHSAGAQLAVWVGTRGRLRTQQVGSEPTWQPNRIISLAGPLDMRTAARRGDTRVVRVLGGTPSQVPDRYRTVDPIENIDPTMPVLVVHGTADTVVPPRQSTAYVDAVRRAGGRVTLRLLRGRTHSDLVTAGSPAFPTVVDLIARTAHSSP